MNNFKLKISSQTELKKQKNKTKNWIFQTLYNLMIVLKVSGRGVAPVFRERQALKITEVTNSTIICCHSTQRDIK